MATTVVVVLGIVAVPAYASVQLSVTTASRSFSPNADGQEDTVPVDYCLSEGANVDIVVKNSALTTVRTLESGVSHGAGCAEATWNGKNTAGTVVANGLYSIAIHAAGASSSDNGTYATQVDTRLPGALTTPHPGATLAGIQSFVFTPTSGFTGIQNVSVDCIGEADAAAGNGTWTAAGDSSACTEGTNSIAAHVAFADSFGAAHSWNSPSFNVTVSNPVNAETAANLPSRSFSPNGDGQEDTVTATYCVSRDATVDVVVKNASNVVVRTLASDVAVPGQPFATGSCFYWTGAPATIDWDGKNDAHAVVANGNYSIVITATDAQLNTSVATYPTAVDVRLPGSITQPASGAHLSGIASFTFTPTAGFTPLDNVSVDCLGAATQQPNGTWVGSGDTTGCAPNVTALNATVNYTDAFGSLHSWQSPNKAVTIALKLVRPAFDISRVFSPNGDGQDDTVTAYYCLTNDAAVTITVHNAAHSLVRTLATSDPQSAVSCSGAPYQGADNTIDWDGKNTAGTVVAAGNYTIDIHAVAGAEHDDLSIATTIDNRAPGALTTPASGASLGATANFVFTPTSGFTGIQDVSVDCINAFSSSAEANGTFIATGPLYGCPSGAASLHSHVDWVDGFGSSHSWTSPTGVPVTLANISLQLGSTPSRSFSPDGDGQEDVLDQGYCLSGDAVVDAVVKNSSNVTVRTLLHSASQSAANGCFANGNNDVTWDGTDAGGHVVPDGNYSIVLHAVAVADSSVADLSIPTTVDNTLPGQMTQPIFGQTLTGLVQFTFTPSAGFESAGTGIDQVTGCFSNDNSCIQILNESPDGLWRTTEQASDLTTGAADFSYSVNYHDGYGVQHSWTAPVAVALSINSNPDPVVAIGASPSSGPAPLATTVHVDLADAPHRALGYSVDFGDSSAPVTGTKLSPYTGGVTLAHSYPTPGSYLVSVQVSDGAGGSEQKTVTIVALGTEQAPSATLAVSPTTGTAPTVATATFSATDADSPTLTYTLDFGDGSAAMTGTLPSSPVGHTYTQPGTYTVRLAVSDGQYTAVRARAVSIGAAEPLAAHAGDDQTSIVNKPVHFDGSASRPLIGITSYSWNFGGGVTATGATVDHTFTTTGAKTVTLTVHRGASVSTDSMSVAVAPVPTVPGLHVIVTGNSAAVPDADVLVLDANDVRHPATTDDTGQARIDGLPDGAYTIYAWHDGFLPTTGDATLVNGSATTTIALTPGSVGQTSLTSTPITDPDTLTALGIDPNDAANQNVYQFEIHLAFAGIPDVTFGGYATGDGILDPVWGGGGGGGGGGECTAGSICTATGDYTVYPRVQYVDSTPTVLWMVIPGRAKWLKEFFDVRVLVTNLGSSVFSFQHGTASLGALPAGLSLAPTSDPQTLTHTMPDIPGGQSAQADWILRGDTEGFYTLGAQYSGSLEPLGSPIHLVASTTSNALHVWGGSALHMTVDTDQTAMIGAPYRVRIQLTNVADVPVFNPSIELLETGRLNYIYSPGEDLIDATDAIQPGDTFSTHFFRLIPEISGTLLTNLSFVKKTAGNTNISSTIVSHTSVPGLPVTGTHTGSSLKLTWNAPAVGNITGYRVYFTANRDTPFGATALASTNTATRTVTIANAAAGYYVVSTLVSGVPTTYHTMFGLATAPQAPIAIAGSGAATIKWTVPASNGGSPVTGYVVTPYLVTGTTSVAQAAHTYAATLTTQPITGLVNAKTYSFSVAAKNANGTGPALKIARPIVIGAPIAPVGITATSGAASAKVTWHAPTNANGSVVTGYVVTPYLDGVAKPAKTFGPTILTATITALLNARSYTFTVAAKNARGVGDLSAATPAIIVGTPNAPAPPTVTAGPTSVTVHWTAPVANGTTAITGYVVTPFKAGVAQAPVTFGLVLTGAVTGLTTGTAYTFTVAAANASGTGKASAPSASVTPT